MCEKNEDETCLSDTSKVWPLQHLLQLSCHALESSQVRAKNVSSSRVGKGVHTVNAPTSTTGILYAIAPWSD
jgi:hypothetical protein